MSAASFRSRLIIGSLLWTLGMLLSVSVALVVFLSTHPRPHAAVFSWFIAVPMAVTGLIGLSCMVAGAVTIARGWRALDRLRARVAEVQTGKTSRVAGIYPSEIQPLADDLNSLLAAREDRAARAAARAADLAHSLKTPLAVLAQDADRVATYDAVLGASVSGEVARMARQIDHHLSQARAVAAGSAVGVRAPVAAAVDGLFRALARLHADAGLTLEHAIPPDVAVRCAAEDLDEMLGNLLDNACVWSHGRVRASATIDGTSVRIDVEDDGDGLEPQLIPHVLQRGARADQRRPGSGLGLAIVRDLAELYGGTLTLDRSPLGGLRAQLTLPATPA